MIKKPFFLLLLTLMSLVAIAGCGGPEVDKEDPVHVSRAATEAWMRSDVDTLIKLSCKRMAKQLEASRASREEMAEMMKAMGVDMKDVEFDFSKVIFKLTDQQEFSAKVHMAGPLTINIPGRSPDVTEQDKEINLVLEDGDWKFCTELN